MAQKESHTEKSSSPLLMPTEFAEMGKKRADEFVKTQTEFLEKLQEMNRQWFDRAQSEASLASEFTSKLTAARSIPEAMAAYQEWASRRFEMMAATDLAPSRTIACARTVAVVVPSPA